MGVGRRLGRHRVAPWGAGPGRRRLGGGPGGRAGAGGGAQPWDGRLPGPVPLAGPAAWAARVPELLAALAWAGQAGGMLHPTWQALAQVGALPGEPDPLEGAPGTLPPPAAATAAAAGPTPLVVLAAPRIGALLAAAWAGDAAGAAGAARGLVGLGPGLTPAGDDLLAGLVATLTLAADSGAPGAWPLAEALMRLLQSGAAARTTPVAQAMLGWTARGHVPAAHGRLAACLLAPEGNWGAALAPVLAHGATSGTDWACGAALALAILARASR